MLHYMTIGYLDVSLVSQRHLEPLKNALADVLPLAVRWGFVDEVTKQPVDGCVIGDGWIRIQRFQGRPEHSSEDVEEHTVASGMNRPDRSRVQQRFERRIVRRFCNPRT
jgi:hypothetical protein